MGMTNWRKKLMKKWWQINKDKVIHKEYLTEQIRARRQPERFYKKLWHILNQKLNPSQQHQTLQMRQIWNIGLDLPALLSFCTAWAGAVEQLLCRACLGRARTCTEMAHGKWLEGVRLFGLKKDKFEVFENLLWKRKGMIQSVLWKG